MTINNRLIRSCVHDMRHCGGMSLWLTFRCLPGIVIASLMLLMLSASPARAQAAEIALDPQGVEGGQLLVRDSTGASYRPALIHHSKVHFDINGIIATVTVEQSFRNDAANFVEGVYAFPLPPGAGIRKLEMVIGERRIVGRIREKFEARKVFEQARRAGKKASLVEQQRPNLFTNRVANIGPGEEVTVKMEYVQQVDFDTDTFSLRFPMTITPRYMPGRPRDASADQGEDEPLMTVNPYLGWAVPTSQVPDADRISPLLHADPGNNRQPLNPVDISATLDIGMPLASVESPYHGIALSRRAGVYSVSLVGGVTEMDRDFVLTWRPVAGITPQAALFTEKVGEQYYGVLMVVPPARQSPGAVVAREMVFVIDTSGSMGGVSIVQARASLSRALQQLTPQDRFNIIEFNSGHRALYQSSVLATRHNVQRAQEFVRLLDASGGTEMLPALREALESKKASTDGEEQARLRQVIFITDGAVGNETELFTEISRTLGDSRLFTVGIGSAPNSWFMRKAAEFGRGTHTHIGDINEVGEKMANLFDQLAQPVVLNISVDWPASVEVWPERIPDIYRGQLLSLAASFGTVAPEGELQIRGDIEGRQWQKTLLLSASAPGEEQAGHPGVASLWARRKIAGLLDQKLAGHDEQQVRNEVLSLALTHQLLSPYTSFIAVEEVVTRPATEELLSQAVPNTRPMGQSPQHFAYPRTATTGPAKLWFGALSLFVALMLRMVRQPEVDHVPENQRW